MIRTDRKGLWLSLTAGLVLLVSLSAVSLAAGDVDDELLQAHLATLYEGNLLPNPDFEEADPLLPNRPLGWEPTYNLSDFNQPIWDSGTYLSGSRSLRMSAPIATEAVWQSVKVPVKAETTYRFVGYVRTQDLVPERARFHGTFLIQAYNGDRMLFPRPTKAGQSLQGTQDWTRVEFTFKTPRNTDSIQVIAAVSHAGRATGHIWFDAVKLEEVVEE